MPNTSIKQALLHILQQEQKPFSVPDLLSFLAQEGITPNKTTLYRALEKMKSENVVNEVLLDSKCAFYELNTHHHHHFVCEKCKSIQCVKDPSLESTVHALEKKLEQNGLNIQSHQFSFSGLCKQCAS